MNRYFKALVVVASLVAALFLTISRRGPDGGLNLATQRQSGAAPRRSAKHYDLSALKVFTVVLGRIKDHYVEPNRIEPKKMMISALTAVERSVAEVLIQESKDKGKVTVRVQDVERTFDLSGVDSPWSLSSRMKDIVRFMQPHLNPNTDIRDVEYAAINGMLSTLDPHSVLLKPEIYNEMKLSTRGEFGGLGIVISMIQGVLTVMNPMKGTPAHEVGIKACDQILKIGEESTVNMTLSQAVSRLRGAPGSKIEITMQRTGWKRPVRKAITRAVIKVDSVVNRMLAKKVGYVKLSSFQGNSHSDLRNAIRKLRRQGMKGLVLDLRGNPGGLLDQAVKISDLFIDSGTLVTTVSHAGKQREEKRARSDGTEDRFPLAVLVNSGSASASEIVAGALKHLDRAIVIGSRTFGKGSVQVLYDNEDGSALKLTIAQYLTPGDISIQSVGITPDVVTRPVVVRKDYIRLRRRQPIHSEADLHQHLTHRNVRRNIKPLRTVRYLAVANPKEEEDKIDDSNLCLYPDRRCKAESEDEFVEDFQIRLGRDLVAEAPGWRRSQILSGAGTLFVRRGQEEQKRVVEAVKKLGVDWSAPPATDKKSAAPQPKLSVAVSGSEAKACQRVDLKVTVRNEGTTPVHRLEAVSKSDNRMFSGHEFVFGRLNPGESRSWQVPVRVMDAPTRVDAVTLDFFDAHDRKYPAHVFQMSTKGVERPTFAYGYQLFDDVQGNLDGRAQRGEQVRLLVKVRNTGKGRAFQAVTTLKNLSGMGIFIRKGRFILGELAPGATRTAAFTFDVQPAYEGREFKLALRVADEGLGEYVTDKLKFSIAAPADAPTKANGTVRINKETPVRAWAADDAPIVGEAPRGSGFSVLGRYPDWYRVQVNKHRWGFVPATAVLTGGKPTPERFVSRWQVTPPKLAVQLPTHATAERTVRITGRASDSNGVSDLFIFVRNPGAKIEGRKVFYKSNRKSKQRQDLEFAADVPLWPGANYVTVFARENEDVQTSETVVVFRKKSAKQLAEGSRAPKKP